MNALQKIDPKFAVVFTRGANALIQFILIIFYGIFRIVSELFREPDKHIGYIFDFISLGSLLSVGMMIFAIIFILKINLNEHNK